MVIAFQVLNSIKLERSNRRKILVLSDECMFVIFLKFYSRFDDFHFSV